MFINARFSRLNGTPLYLIHPSSAWESPFFLSHSLQIWDLVFWQITSLEFFKGPRQCYLAVPFACRGIGTGEPLVHSAGIWCLVAHPPWVMIFSSSSFPVDCLDPTCSSHGVCVNGECLCSPGWGGLNCELARVQCPDQCSGHGTYLPDTGLCSCDPNWMGPDCSVGKSRGLLLTFPNTCVLCPPVSPNAWASTPRAQLGT